MPRRTTTAGGGRTRGIGAAVLAGLFAAGAAIAVADVAPTAEGLPADAGEAAATEETIVVTASRVEESAHDAPVAVNVVGREAIATSAATNFADLLRGVPGVSVVQLSSKDVQVTTRGPGGAYLRGNLLLLDGRTLNEENDGLAFFDHLPVDMDEIEQVEIVNGPASAVWGPHALHGVINVRTRPLRDIEGGLLRVGAGENGRRDGWMRWTDAGERLSWRLSGGWSTQDAWPRPTAKPDGTPFPPSYAYLNRENDQARADLRIDVEPRPDLAWSIRAGRATSGGISFTTDVPFHHHPGTGTTYLDVARNGARTQARLTWSRFEGTGTSVLGGAPSDFRSDLAAAELVQPTALERGAHRLTWGGGVRRTQFDVDAAPSRSSRLDVGAFVEDAWTVRERDASSVTLHLGTRFDHFETSGLAVSPRLALVWKATPRVSLRSSWNRAFRSPTVLNSWLDLTLPSAVDLGGTPFFFDIAIRGNEDLDEVVAEQVEIGVHAFAGARHEIAAAAYRKHVEDDIVLHVAAVYGPGDPPAGWPLDPALVPPLPKLLTYSNAGRVRSDGVEVGLTSEWPRGLTTRFGWTWQRAPVVTAEDGLAAAVNVPPRHQLSARLMLVRDRWKGGLGAVYTGEATWNDVLDARFWGETDDHLLVDASASVELAGKRVELTVGATNLTDDRVQQHVFGDVIGREATVEVRTKF